MESIEKGERVSQIHAEIDRKIEIVDRYQIVFTRIKLVLIMIFFAALALYRVPADIMQYIIIALSLFFVTMGVAFLIVPESLKTMVLKLGFLAVFAASMTMAFYSLNSI